MDVLKHIARFSAIAAAVAIASGASAHGMMKNAPQTLSFEQMQANSSEGPTWHAGDGSIYDPNRTLAMYGRTSPRLAFQQQPALNAPVYSTTPVRAPTR